MITVLELLLCTELEFDDYTCVHNQESEFIS